MDPVVEPLPFVESVLHPTDLSGASDRAFAHALAIAVLLGTKFTIFHAAQDRLEDWQNLPRVRETLERWGLLDAGSPASAVSEHLSVGVKKVQVEGDPVLACFEEIKRSEPDLVVMATEGRDGLARWLRPSVAARIARRSGTLALMVPAHGRGFVDSASGRLSLRRIVVPVDEKPDPHQAITRATRAAEIMGDGEVQIDLLRVNADPVVPTLPKSEAFVVRGIRVDGDVVESILAAGRDADLLVMPTDGRDNALDFLLGSHTERVVRALECPLLAVPAF